MHYSYLQNDNLLGNSSPRDRFNRPHPLGSVPLGLNQQGTDFNFKASRNGMKHGQGGVGLPCLNPTHVSPEHPRPVSQVLLGEVVKSAQLFDAQAKGLLWIGCGFGHP
jgi:hypothetical protein